MKLKQYFIRLIPIFLASVAPLMGACGSATPSVPASVSLTFSYTPSSCYFNNVYFKAVDSSNATVLFQVSGTANFSGVMWTGLAPGLYNVSVGYQQSGAFSSAILSATMNFVDGANQISLTGPVSCSVGSNQPTYSVTSYPH
jgi:hypothetical protein